MNLSFPQMPDKLTSTEQDIVEYIAAHRDEFLCMTIGQLSAALHISEATVSRFARRLRGLQAPQTNGSGADRSARARSEIEPYPSDRRRRLTDRLAGTAALQPAKDPRSAGPGCLCRSGNHAAGGAQNFPPCPQRLPCTGRRLSARGTSSCCSALPKCRRRPGSFWSVSSKPATGPSFSPAAFGTAKALALRLNFLSIAGTKRNSTR